MRLRTWLVFSLVLLLSWGVITAFYWVYDRGLRREGLFDKAQRAYREHRYDDALEMARETLVSEPDHHLARELILASLVASDRHDEAKAEARKFLKEDPEEHTIAVRLCQMALRDGDGEEAERLALGFADRDPAYAYRILAVVRDHRGLLQNDWRLRLSAVAVMRSLASLTEDEAIRAEALIFAAEVGHEVAPSLPQGALLEQRARADLQEAVSAVNAASQANRAYPYEIAMGRIRILSDDPQEAALGARMLRPHVSGSLQQDVAVAALAKYHIERNEWVEALDLVRSLQDMYLWHRLYWLVRRSNDPLNALPLVENGPLAGTPDGELLRDELLVRSGDPAAREKALESLRTMVADPESSSNIVLRAVLLLAGGGGVDMALAAADGARLEERGDPQLTALLAALLNAEGSERGLALAERLARQTDELTASRDLMRLLGGTGQAFDRYVDTQVSKGGESETPHRLHRALSMLARAAALKNDKEGARELRQRVRADLAAVRDSGNATKAGLVAAFQLAASLGDAQLAGELLSRAFTLPGAPNLLDARILAFARELKDEATLEALAEGIRQGAADSPARAFLEVFADAVATPNGDDAAGLVKRLEDAAKEPGSRVQALEFASRIALGAGQPADAERLARAAHAEDPSSTGALEILGAVLLRRGATQEVIDLYRGMPSDELPEAAYRQLAHALLSRGRRDEALATAREALRRFPQSAATHLLVAQLYRDLGEPRKALSVLNLAPPDPLTVHMRAELLRQLGDPVMAERLYQVLLSSSHFTDLSAWQGLMETLVSLKRAEEFVVLCKRALDSSALANMPQKAAMVHYLRGMCLEVEGKVEEALADYQTAVRLDDTNWGALNNAAWHIARTAPARVAEARALVDRALQLKPDNPAVLDTAAEVHSVQQDLDGALRLVDRALALGGQAKVPTYLVHKARILLRGQREEEAKGILEEVRVKYETDPAAQRARSLLWEIERKNLPEEEPVQLPALPEDEEEVLGNGGGE